jgi:hypothetical protein
MVDLAAFGKAVGRLLLVAARSFLVTLLAFTALGLVLAAVCWYWMSRTHPVYGVIAAVVALLEAVVLGVILGGKRALVTALVRGLRRYRLGGTVVGLLFHRLLGASAEATAGGAGAWLARAAERVPLAQAEARLSGAVSAVLAAPAEGGGLLGWGRRRLQTRLVGAVGKYTLARFREAGAKEGGVDLVKVQAELAAKVDDGLAGKLAHGVNLWTALALVALPAQVFATVWVVLALLK